MNKQDKVQYTYESIKRFLNSHVSNACNIKKYSDLVLAEKDLKSQINHFEQTKRDNKLSDECKELLVHYNKYATLDKCPSDAALRHFLQKVSSFTHDNRQCLDLMRPLPNHVELMKLCGKVQQELADREFASINNTAIMLLEDYNKL